MATPNMGEHSAGPTVRQRGLATLPLLVPGLAGLAYLALFGAPQNYVMINAGALAAGLVWVAFGRLPSSTIATRISAIALVALLALPVLTGPHIAGLSRWLTVGGFTLHVGLMVIPLIAVLAASDEQIGPYTVLAAMGVTVIQPDAASTMALTGAAFGLALAAHDRRAAVLGALGLLATAWASLSSNLSPQPFVERVIPDLWSTAPIAAVLLALSLVASLTLILRASGAARSAKFALAGSMAGFTLAALIGDYPTPLIGYGAASIIGLGLALPGLRRSRSRVLL